MTDTLVGFGPPLPLRACGFCGSSKHTSTDCTITVELKPISQEAAYVVRPEATDAKSASGSHPDPDAQSTVPAAVKNRQHDEGAA